MKQTQRWPVAVAKAKFSQLMEEVKLHGPQTVTRHGRPAIVVVSAEDWETRAKRSQRLTEFLRQSPLRGSGLKAPRLRGKWRKIDL